MINPKDFYNELAKNKINFFAGVPDSLLKYICVYINDNTRSENNIITANEGGAIALGTGYHLATNKIPLIYMQNSGIGNAVNPLMSLADQEVYSIPMLLMIGWRGEPGIKDEPQHIKQGRITPTLLEAMEVSYQILDKNSNFKQIIKKAVEDALLYSAPVAILIKKNTFDTCKIDQPDKSPYKITREEALELVLKHIPNNSIVVSTTGMLSRELYELREKYFQSHQTDFYTVGSMGHTSQIALGIALAKPQSRVFCFDGDGSALMHLGHYAIAGNLAPKNLMIILYNNGAHDSVGGQQTVGHFIDFSQLIEAVKIKSFGSVQTAEEINYIMPKLIKNTTTAFLDVRIKKGARINLGRPTQTPIENKQALIEFLKNN